MQYYLNFPILHYLNCPLTRKNCYKLTNQIHTPKEKAGPQYTLKQNSRHKYKSTTIPRVTRTQDWFMETCWFTHVHCGIWHLGGWGCDVKTKGGRRQDNLSKDDGRRTLKSKFYGLPLFHHPNISIGISFSTEHKEYKYQQCIIIQHDTKIGWIHFSHHN